MFTTNWKFLFRRRKVKWEQELDLEICIYIRQSAVGTSVMQVKYSQDVEIEDFTKDTTSPRGCLKLLCTCSYKQMEQTVFQLQSWDRVEARSSTSQCRRSAARSETSASLTCKLSEQPRGYTCLWNPEATGRRCRGCVNSLLSYMNTLHWRHFAESLLFKIIFIAIHVVGFNNNNNNKYFTNKKI